MCHEFWTLRRRDEAEEARRLWENFDRNRPAEEPDRPAEEPPVTLEQRPEVSVAE
jgi:hypothetical protein